MKIKQALLLPLCFATSIAGAAQFESVIDAMAIKATEGQTNNDWKETTKIKGYVTVACGTGLSISCLYVQQKQSLEACDESA